MEILINDDIRDQYFQKNVADAIAAMARKSDKKMPAPGRKSETKPAADVPTPPSWGHRVVRDMPLEIIFTHIDKKELYRLSWGAKNTRGERWDQLKKNFDDRFYQMTNEVLRTNSLQPQGVYGYWPVQSVEDKLLIYDPDMLSDTGKKTIISELNFPRQIKKPGLSIADYFSPVSSGIIDCAAFQVVTVGDTASKHYDELQAKDDFSEGYFFHGLAVQTAEATADYLNIHIRKELKLAVDRGKRYSWGYPSIPSLDDHAIIFSLLPAEDQLGMTLTNSFQLVPEQSTAAMFVHHPDAKYFNVGKVE